MAQQFQSPENYAAGQQLTAARLNNMVNNAVPLPGLITDRTDLASNTVASTDSVLLHDVSASALVEATASDLLNSNIPVTTSSVTAGTGSDITITPNDGTTVTGSTYISGDGLTVVVTTAAAHGLLVGQVVLISSASAGYNGTFRITAVTTISPFTFTYVMTTAATPGSGSLAYTRKAMEKTAGNKSVTGNLYVDGNAIISGTTIQSGVVTQNGTVNQIGTVNQSGTINQTGTVNVTGAIQYNGTPVYGLYEITTYTVDYVAYSSATTPIWTSPTLSKPSDEIWEIDAVGSWIWYYGTSPTTCRFYFYNNAITVKYAELFFNAPYETGGSMKFIIPAGTALTSETFKLLSTAGNKVTPSNSDGVKMYIKKYKTA